MNDQISSLQISGDTAKAVCRAFNFGNQPQSPVVAVQAGNNGVSITCHNAGKSKELVAEANGRLTLKTTGDGTQQILTLYADGSIRATTQNFSPITGLTGVRSGYELPIPAASIRSVRGVAARILPLVRPFLWHPENQGVRPPLDLDKIIKG